MFRRARLASWMVPALAAMSLPGCSSGGAAPDWIGSVTIVCIEVEQSYRGVPGHQEPIAETIGSVLGRMGIDARVGTGPDCPATLTLAFEMTPVAKPYSGAPHDCYTDVRGSGRATLASAEGTARYPLEVSRSGGPVISQCPTEPGDAPFRTAWGNALVPWLAEWWGAPALVSALESGNWAMRDLASRRIALTPGAAEMVPDLIVLLGHDDAEVRAAAAQAIDWIGPGAAAAVPALVTLLDDPMTVYEALSALEAIGPAAADACPALIAILESNASWRESAAVALAAITTLDLGTDAAAWREALGLGPGPPTTAATPTTTTPVPTAPPAPPEPPAPEP
jgi:hypothetical protein